MRILIVEYVFKGIKIGLYNNDLEHALEAHPEEVSIEKIKSCIEDPDIVIQSAHGKNGCLFYEKKQMDEYFVVVVHTTSALLGEVKTAYNSTYLKKGTILFKKAKL